MFQAESGMISVLLTRSLKRSSAQLRTVRDFLVVDRRAEPQERFNFDEELGKILSS